MRRLHLGTSYRSVNVDHAGGMAARRARRRVAGRRRRCGGRLACERGLLPPAGLVRPPAGFEVARVAAAGESGRAGRRARLRCTTGPSRRAAASRGAAPARGASSGGASAGHCSTASAGSDVRACSDGGADGRPSSGDASSALRNWLNAACAAPASGPSAWPSTTSRQDATPGSTRIEEIATSAGVAAPKASSTLARRGPCEAKAAERGLARGPHRRSAPLFVLPLQFRLEHADRAPHALLACRDACREIAERAPAGRHDERAGHGGRGDARDERGQTRRRPRVLAAQAGPRRRVRGKRERGPPRAQARTEAVRRLGQLREVQVLADVERLDVERQFVHERAGQRPQVDEVSADEHAADVHLLVLAHVDQRAAQFGGDARRRTPARAALSRSRLGAIGLGRPTAARARTARRAVHDRDGRRLRVDREDGDHGVRKERPGAAGRATRARGRASVTDSTVTPASTSGWSRASSSRPRRRHSRSARRPSRERAGDDRVGERAARAGRPEPPAPPGGRRPRGRQAPPAAAGTPGACFAGPTRPPTRGDRGPSGPRAVRRSARRDRRSSTGSRETPARAGGSGAPPAEAGGRAAPPRRSGRRAEAVQSLYDSPYVTRFFGRFERRLAGR